MKWFRYWHSTLDNKKAQRLPDALFKLWINLLCAACRNDPDHGTLPDLDDLEFELRISRDILAEAVANLVAAGFIDRGRNALRIHDWRHWQSSSDSTAAERMRRHRDRNVTAAVTRNSDRNAMRNEARNDTCNPPVIHRVTLAHAEARAPVQTEDGETEDSLFEHATGINPREPGVVSGEPEPQAIPSYPDPETSPLMICPGPHEVDETEARALWNLLWRQWSSPRLCNGFYEHQRWYPADCWRAAIRDAVRRNVRPETVKYLERVAAGFKAHGIPDEHPPPANGHTGPARKKPGDVMEEMSALQRRLNEADPDYQEWLHARDQVLDS